MAIGSIFKYPSLAQPVYTNGLFYAATSDKTSQYKFRFVWDVYLNDVKIYRGKTTPNPQGIGVFDVSNIVEAFLESNVKTTDNSTTFDIHTTEKFSQQDREYNYPQAKDLDVRVGEEYSTTPTGQVVIYNGLTDNPGTPSFISNPTRVYNGTMINNFLYRNEDFDFTPYIMRDSSDLFLTDSPRNRTVRSDDYYTLSFANYRWYTSDTYTSLPRAVKYDWYDNNGTSISSTTVDNIYSNGGGPWSACTDNLQIMVNNAVVARDWSILNVGAGPKNLESIMPSGTTFYDVTMMGNDWERPNPPGQDSCGEGVCAPGYIKATVRRCDDLQEFCACVSTSNTIGSTHSYDGYCYEIISTGTTEDLSSTWQIEALTPYSDCDDCLATETPSCLPLSAVSETFHFEIDDTCLKFNQLQFVWLNRYGTWDYYRFLKGKSEGVKIDRLEYQKYNINWGEASQTNPPTHLNSSRGRDVFNVSMTETHVVNTGFINIPDFQYLEGLYTSPQVYIIESDGTLNPVVVMTTDFVRKTRGNTNVVNLELSYQYANNLKLNR